MRVIIHKLERQIDRKELSRQVIELVRSGQLSSRWLKLVEELESEEEETYERGHERSS